MILLNKWVTVDKGANQVEISHGSAYEIIHNRLGFHKVCAQWVPKQLTESQKQKHLDICIQLLDHFGNEGDLFLERIVMGDETWIHPYKPQSKCQNMEWKHRYLPLKEKV
jgi:hypothetical protein